MTAVIFPCKKCGSVVTAILVSLIITMVAVAICVNVTFKHTLIPLAFASNTNITANDIKFFNITGELHNITDIKALKSACNALEGLGLRDPSHCPEVNSTTGVMK